MTSGRKIVRRSFLVGSVAIAGGVAFGTYLVTRTHDNPLAETLGPGEASFNPWVRITSDTITLITPHVDLGQGAVHMQALLLAEELDVEPGQFETDFGPPDPAFYNTVMASEGAPFAPHDDSIPATLARSALGAVGKVIGLQGTGGSTSVADSYDKLRQAGAVARETLKRAAAQISQTDVRDLSTKAGHVVLPDGTALPYQELAVVAATLKPSSEVALRPKQGWRLLGALSERLDIVPKSTGAQKYGVDVRLDGMVYAAVRLSPTRAAVETIDASAAQSMPGVRDVLALTDGLAVIADNTWTAMRGALALDVTWKPAAYPSDQADHWAVLEASFTKGKLDKTWRADGRVVPADAALTAEYRAPYVAHQPLEPLNATVLVRDNAVEVWASSQLPRYAQTQVANVTGHRADQVVFHNQYAGGSFGHRLELDNIALAAEIGNQIRGTPVKLTFSREEDFARDYPRHISIGRARGHVRDGAVTGLALDIAAAPPIVSQTARLGQVPPGADGQIAAGAWAAPYALESFHVSAYRADGLAPVSSWRSVGASSAGFYLESFLDELIHAAGADPLQERLRLCSWDVARGVLERVAEMSDWGRDLGRGRGMGVALVESFGVPAAEVVQVSQSDAGLIIEDVWVAVDAGTVIDPVNFENQVQGGVVWGLGHAINSEITYKNGRAEQSNYHAAEGMRLYQTPRIAVEWLENNHVIRGIGEPPVPPAAPALANAIFAATGTRLREMPFGKFIQFA